MTDRDPRFDLPEPGPPDETGPAEDPRREGGDRPDSEGRHIGGWVALFGILFALIGLQLVAYLGRKPDSAFELSGISQQFQITVAQRQALALTGSSAAADTAIRGSFDTLLDRLRPKVASEPDAAVMYVAMRHEQGDDVTPEDLEAVERGTGEQYALVAEVYREDEITLERAREIRDALATYPFAFRMAGLHALEKAGDTASRSEMFPRSKAIVTFLAISLIGGMSFLGILLWMVYGMLRAAGKLKPIGHPIPALTALEADGFAMRAAIMLVVFMVGGSLFGSSLAQFLPENAAKSIAYTLVVVTTIWLAAVPVGPRRLSLLKLAVRKKDALVNVAWGVGAACANLPVVLALAVFFQWLLRGLPAPSHPVTIELANRQDLATVILLFMLATVVAPIVEELMFRGAMLPAMVRLFASPVLAILCSSLLFAAIHPTGIPAWPALAMTGAVAAMVGWQRGSLVSSIAMHATHNFALVTLTTALF